jgi:hypothetical protein
VKKAAPDKEAHAKRQQKYYAEKMETHMRVCFWLPKAAPLEAVRSAVDRAIRRWQKA